MPDRRALLRSAASLGVACCMAGGARSAWAQSGTATGGATPVARVPRLPDRPAPALGSLIETPRTELIDGSIAEAGAWRGKVLLVQLWATWCPFCAKQNPLIDKLWRARRADGLDVLGLSIDEKPDLIKRYLADHGYRFPVARFDQSWWTVLGRPKGLPVLWVIGRDSRLKQLEVGEMFPEDIELLEKWI